MARKFLTEQQIEEILLEDGSDVDSCCSDDSVRDPDWDCPESSDDECSFSKQSEVRCQQSTEYTDITLCAEEQNSKEPEQRVIVLSEKDGLQMTSSTMQHDQYKRIIWKNKFLELPEQQTKFRGKTSLPGDILELNTPSEFLRKFISDDILLHIVEESTRYSIQVDPSKPFELTVDELRKYLGICYVMSYMHLPSTRDYWSDTYGSQLKETMSSKRFEKIRQFLHFNDNNTELPKDSPQYERLHKMRPFIEHLREKFAQVPFEESLSVDEQICATKARSFIKQYLPSKPH